MLCALISCISGGVSYCLKSTSKDRVLRKFLWQFLFIPRVFARNLFRGNPRRNIDLKSSLGRGHRGV